MFMAHKNCHCLLLVLVSEIMNSYLSGQDTTEPFRWGFRSALTKKTSIFYSAQDTTQPFRWGFRSTLTKKAFISHSATASHHAVYCLLVIVSYHFLTLLSSCSSS